MSARIITNYKNWFGKKRLQEDQLLKAADRQIKAIEYVLNKLRYIRTEAEVARMERALVANYKPENLMDELVNVIMHSEPSFWRANDVYYRAVVALFKSRRPNA